jgi:hypothetical protein
MISCKLKQFVNKQRKNGQTQKQAGALIRRHLHFNCGVLVQPWRDADQRSAHRLAETQDFELPAIEQSPVANAKTYY